MTTRRQQQSERGPKSGLLRSWLCSAFLFGGDAPADAGEDAEFNPAANGQHCAASTAALECKRRRSEGGEQRGVVLPFPIRGEALLVRLAELLRHRVGDRCAAAEPFLFTMTRRTCSRLAIDYRSAVEFNAERSEFRFELDVAPNTNIVIRTVDFDTLVEFVVQYVAARLAESPSLEAAW